MKLEVTRSIECGERVCGDESGDESDCGSGECGNEGGDGDVKGTSPAALLSPPLHPPNNTPNNQAKPIVPTLSPISL